jgi:hypothetical protein
LEAALVPDGAMCASHPEIGASFTCARCGSFGCPGCAFSAIPGREVCRICAAHGLGEPIPWERRKEIGYWRAFWYTTRLATRRPREFFKTPATEPGAMSPVFYGVAVYAFGQYVYVAMIALSLVVFGAVAAAVAEEPLVGAIAGGYSVFFVLIVLLQAPVQGLMGVLFGSACVHGALALMKQTSAPFEQTMRAVSYANAPYFFYFIPCVGPFLSWLWMVWVETVAVRETHRIGTDRAVLAVVGYRVLFILLVVVGYAALFGLVFLAEQAGR